MRIILWLAALLPIFYAAIRFSAEFHPAWLHDIFAFSEPYIRVVMTKTPADPLKFLSDLSGNSALAFLAATLSVTPLKSYLKINLLRYRRMLGLLSFFYAMLHAVLFIGADQQFEIAGVLHEIADRAFIAFGMGAFGILLLLALGSVNGLYAKFKAWHKLIYVAVVLIAIHYLMSHKTVTVTHVAVVGSLFSLLALRLMKR